MRPVDPSAQDVLSFSVFHLGVGLIFEDKVPGAACGRDSRGDGAAGTTTTAAAGGAGTWEGLVADGAGARSQGHVAVETGVQGEARFGSVESLPAVADDVLVESRVLQGIGSVLVLALTTGSAEEAVFALSTASYAGRIMGIVDATEVAADFPTPAGDACLINALVLGRLLRRLRGRAGSGCRG